MLSYIVIALIVLVAGFLAVASQRPDTFRVERSTRINARPDRVYGHLDDFHKWGAWSPWDKLDPAMTRTFSGPSTGIGAGYEWNGSRKVGMGRMEITDVSVPNRLVLRLDFIKPFKATNTTEFTLAGNGESTDVTWAMYGPSPLMSKVMGVLMNMDKMIGADFEKGLANLKSVAEG